MVVNGRKLIAKFNFFPYCPWSANGAPLCYYLTMVCANKPLIWINKPFAREFSWDIFANNNV